MTPQGTAARRSELIDDCARTDAGQLVVVGSFHVFPARWNEVHSALGSINDRFSVMVNRNGRSWCIDRGQLRWSFTEGAFIRQQIFGPGTSTEDLDEALAVAAQLAEQNTSIRGETFAQIAARLLDNPDSSDPDVVYIRARQAGTRL